MVSASTRVRGAAARAVGLDAEADAQRFLLAAQLRHRHWQAEYGGNADAATLMSAAASLGHLSSIDAIPSLCRAIAGTPPPIGVFSDERTRIPKGPA